MMVHVYFKQNDKYKVRMFLNSKALFEDPIKLMEDIIEKYEISNRCCLGDNRELKVLNLSEEYLNENGVQVFEQELTDLEFIEDLKKSQPIVEIN